MEIKLELILAILVIVLVIAIFIISYVLNKKTPIPEGCEDLDAECETCPVTTCLKNNSKKEE